MLLKNIYLSDSNEEWIQRKLKWWNESDQSSWVDPNVLLSVPNVYLEVLFKYQHLIKELENIDIFVETGTEEGATSDIMTKHFKQVYTVESNLNIKVRENILDCQIVKNIEYLRGDSPKVLEQLRSVIINQRCVFFLDAHDNKSTCLEGELRTIKKYSNKDSVIIVDDGVDIGVCNFYPSLSEFKRLIYDINPDYNILFTNLGRKICLIY